jgi:hypothetical protein
VHVAILGLLKMIDIESMDLVGMIAWKMRKASRKPRTFRIRPTPRRSYHSLDELSIRLSRGFQKKYDYRMIDEPNEIQWQILIVHLPSFA